MKLKFADNEFSVITHLGQPFLTLQDIALSLYQNEGGAQTATPFRRVRDLYRRHKDEFTQSMTALVKVKTVGGEQDIRVFSLRGAHLLGMFARTERAKGFRRWVLDVLDSYQVESIDRYSKYQQLLHVYSNRRAHVSSCAREMAHWRIDKKPIESKLSKLEQEIQPGQI